MDQNSRFYDYFSDAYAEISLDPDGFYQIGNPDQQYGKFDVFVNQDSLDLGDLVVDAKNLSGKGLENVSITGWKLDLYKSIDVTNPYSTEVSNINGTLTYVDGIASNLNLECDIMLTFTSGLVNGLAFPGQIIIKDNHWGEILHAYVKLKKDIDSDILLSKIKKDLPKHMVPKKIIKQ